MRHLASRRSATRSLAPKLAAVAVVLLGLPAAAKADERVHVVAEGESLGLLSARYSVSVAELREWNGLESDTIRVGQPLSVQEAAAIRVRVLPGDTLRCVAQRYRVPLARILEDNPTAARRLEAGRTLVLRGATEPRRDAAEPTGTMRVTVEPGDTLTNLAARHHVTLAELTAANPTLDPDLLVVGAEVEVPTVAGITYTVAAGDTLGRIARRHDVEVRQLREWNPDVRPDRLPIGTELALRTGHASESVGAAFCGHIVGAAQLGEHPGYVLRNPDRSWATSRTIRRLRGGFDAVARAHPDGPRPRVHDLSLRGGGPIDDHRSHQSGRDVDITYYRNRGCGDQGCPLERVDPDDLDVRRQWTLLRHWLRRGEIEAIYVDHGLQAALHREARRRGATPAQLREWFQYPSSRHHSEGRIRHFPNHRDHLHVRFACDRSERDCR